MPSPSQTRLCFAAIVLSGVVFATGTRARDLADELREMNIPQPPRAETTGSAVQQQQPSAIPQAPVGHRQPRAADVPASTTGSGNDAFSARIKELNRDPDRDLRICKGC